MSTHALLRCGVIAGPLYLAAGLAQAFLRQGFDLTRHPLSVLANGPGGWVQTINFLVTGALVLAASLGLRRVLGSRAHLMAGFLGAFGLAMIVAAIFPADAVDGFPPGTAAGPPSSISPTGLVHFASGALGFLCLALSSLLGWRILAQRGEAGLGWLSLATGAGVLSGFVGGMVLPIGILGIWFAVVAGWVWLSVVSLRLGAAEPATRGE